MTTAITINSLIRFDEGLQKAWDPSPFDFRIRQEHTEDWIFERRPFSRTALTKVTDSFRVKLCKVFVPKRWLPELPPVLHLELKDSTSINRTIGPRVKDSNVIGVTGLSAGSAKFPNELPNYNQTFPLYPAYKCETDDFWIFESCASLSMNEDWRRKNLRVRLRDACGFLLLPAGFTQEQLCSFDRDNVDDAFRPLFEKDSQMIIILKVHYVENDAVGLEECF